MLQHRKLVTRADGSVEGCWYGVAPEAPLSRQSPGSYASAEDLTITNRMPHSLFVPASSQSTIWIKSAMLFIWGAGIKQFGVGSLTVKTPDDTPLPWRVLIPYMDGETNKFQLFSEPGIPLTKDDQLCVQASWRSYANNMEITPLFGANPTCLLQFSIQITYRIGG